MSGYFENLERWFELQAAIKKLTAEERGLREALFKGSFKNPKEGVNTLDLPDGRKLKGTYKINRNVREDDLAKSGLPKKLKDTVFRTKHELVTSEYRKLSPEEQAEVDKVLDIKPGLPGLELKD